MFNVHLALLWTFVIYSVPSRSSKLVSYSLCLPCWSSVAAGTECIKGAVCCKASRFFHHHCPNLDVLLAKVALLFLVVLVAVPALCIVSWVVLCCCCWSSDSYLDFPSICRMLVPRCSPVTVLACWPHPDLLLREPFADVCC